MLNRTIIINNGLICNAIALPRPAAVHIHNKVIHRSMYRRAIQI